MSAKQSNWILAVSLSVLTGALGGCGKHSKPNVIFMPDMYYSPSLKAQEEGSMRMPVPGTIARDQELPYDTTRTVEEAKELKNPLQRTKTALVQGQKAYNTYCIVCHGPLGEGNGYVVPKYPAPPTLQSEKVKNWTDGQIFHTITVGQNTMPSYASQISPQDRWAVAHYIRALQRAKNPTPEDLAAYEKASQ